MKRGFTSLIRYQRTSRKSSLALSFLPARGDRLTRSSSQWTSAHYVPVELFDCPCVRYSTDQNLLNWQLGTDLRGRSWFDAPAPAPSPIAEAPAAFAISLHFSGGAGVHQKTH